MSTLWEPRLGAVYLGGGRCRFRVWASRRRTVELHLAAPRDRVVPMERRDGDYFEVTLGGVEPGTRYLYRLDGEVERPTRRVGRSRPRSTASARRIRTFNPPVNRRGLDPCRTRTNPWDP